MARRKFNWKLVLVVAIAVFVFGITAVGLHKWQRAHRAGQGLKIGTQAYEDKNWLEAAQNLGRYLSINQEDVDILLKYAHAQLNIRPPRQGNINQAIQSYRQILRIAPDNTEAATQLVYIFSTMSNVPGEAEIIVRKALKKNNDPAVKMCLARVLLQQKKIDDINQDELGALSLIKEIIKENPDNVEAYDLLGRGITQQLHQQQKNIKECYEKGIVPFDDAVKNNPSSTLAYLQRASFHRQFNHMDKIHLDLEKALSQAEITTEEHLRIAEELIWINELEKAENILTQLEKDDADNLGLWKTWAFLVWRSDNLKIRVDKIVQGFNILSATNRWDFMMFRFGPVVGFTAMDLLILAEKYELALKLMESIEQADIRPAQTAMWRGMIYRQQKNDREAIRQFEKALQLGDKMPRIQSARLQAYLVDVLIRNGDIVMALQNQRQMVLDYPNEFESHFKLAGILLRLGFYAEAEQEARKAWDINKKSLNALLLAFRAQLQQINYQNENQRQKSWKTLKAQLSEIEKEVENNPDITQLHFFLSLKLKDYDDAEKRLTELKLLSQENKNLEKTILTNEVDLLLSQGNVDLGKSKLNELTAKFPDWVDPVIRLADLYAVDRQNLEKGKQQCERLIRQALDRFQDDKAIRLSLIRFLANQYRSWNKKSQAYKLFESEAEKFPRDIRIRRELLLLERHPDEEVEKAQITIDEIREIEGDHGWQWRYEQAKLWFSEPLKDFPDVSSLKALAFEMKINWDNLENRLISDSETYWNQMQLIAYLRNAFGNNTNLCDLHYSDSSLAAIDAIKVDLSQKTVKKIDPWPKPSRYSQIVSLLKDNLEKNSSDQESRLLLALVYRTSDENELASILYREAYDFAPYNKKIMLSAIESLQACEKYDDAEELINQAKQKGIYDLSIKDLELQNRINQREWGQAENILKEQVKANPNNLFKKIRLADVLIRNGQSGRTSAEAAQEKYRQADKILTNLYKMREELSETHCLKILDNTIKVKLLQGQKEKIYALCDQIIEKHKNYNGYLLRLRALMSLVPDKLEDARFLRQLEDDFEQTLKLAPDQKAQAGILLLRSNFLVTTQQKDKARQALADAHHYNKDNQIVLESYIDALLMSESQSDNQKGKDLLEEALQKNPKSKNLRFQKAFHLLLRQAEVFDRKGDPSFGPKADDLRRQAGKILKDLTEEDPRNYQAWAQLILGAYRRLDFEKAVELADQALVFSPNIPNILLLKYTSQAQFDAQNQEMDKAYDAINKALEISPDSPHVLNSAISIYFASEKPEYISKGNALLEEALRKNPQDVEFRFLRANYLLSQADRASDTRKITQLHEQAREIMKDIVKDQPRFSRGWHRLSQLALVRKKYDDAIEWASRGLAHSPYDKDLLVVKSAAQAEIKPEKALPTLQLFSRYYPDDLDNVLRLARMYLLAKQPDNSINLLKKQLETLKEPDDQNRIKMEMAYVLYNSDKKNQAIEIIEAVQKNIPDKPAPVLVQLGLYREDNRWEEFSDRVSQWLKSHPDDKECQLSCYVLEQIAERQVVGDKIHNAVDKIFQEIMERNPGNSRALNAVLGWAVALQVNNHIDTAIKWYQLIIDKQPENVIAINNLAWLFCEYKQQYQQALQLARNGSRLRPSYIDIIDTRGVIYYRMEKFDLAVKDFTKCVNSFSQDSPGLAGSYFHLGRAQARLDQKDKARISLEKAKVLHNQIGGLSPDYIEELNALLEKLK